MRFHLRARARLSMGVRQSMPSHGRKQESILQQEPTPEDSPVPD